MALYCYMPETHIRPLFTDLEREANSPALQKLVITLKLHGFVIRLIYWHMTLSVITK